MQDAPVEEAKVEIPKVKMRHGQGTMVNGDNVYEGEWAYDAMQGNGAYLCFPHNDCVAGLDSFRLGAVRDAGLFKFAGGASYDGEWKNNQFHGKGKYTWASKAYYIGDFENNKCDTLVFVKRTALTRFFERSLTGVSSNMVSWFLRWFCRMHGEGAYYDEEGRRWTGALPRSLQQSGTMLSHKRGVIAGKFYNGAGPGLHTL